MILKNKRKRGPFRPALYLIDDDINLTATKFKNKNKIFGPSKCPVNFSLPWIGPASQSFADKVAFSVYHAVKVRSVFATEMAFNSIRKDVLPIMNQSLLVYKFNCRCNSTYIGRTSQCLEVRIRQHVPRGILNSGWSTSGHSQAMDSATGEHILTTNSCRTDYLDDWFSVLHRARNKIHLDLIEAIYISLDRSFQCRQRTNHNLYILGELLNTGETWFLNFFCHIFSFHI